MGNRASIHPGRSSPSQIARTGSPSNNPAPRVANPAARPAGREPATAGLPGGLRTSTGGSRPPRSTQTLASLRASSPTADPADRPLARTNFPARPTSGGAASAPVRMVPLGDVLGVPGKTIKNVLPAQIQTMKLGDEAIRTTKAFLPYGAGNQELDVVRTQGEAARRTTALHAMKGHYSEEDKSHIRNPADVSPHEQSLMEIKNGARLATSVGAGTCGEQADVAMAALSLKPRDVPIHKVQFEFMDHAMLIAGNLADPRSLVAIDPWPLHASSHAMRDGLASGLPFKKLHTLAPEDPPLFSAEQLEGFKRNGVSQQQIDAHNPGRPAGPELVQSLKDGWTLHHQPHALKNPGVVYQALGEGGQLLTKRHEVPQAQQQIYAQAASLAPPQKPALMVPEEED